MPKIKVCKHCGAIPEAKASTRMTKGYVMPNRLFQVTCTCGAEGPARTQKLEAILLWNDQNKGEGK